MNLIRSRELKELSLFYFIKIFTIFYFLDILKCKALEYLKIILFLLLIHVRKVKRQKKPNFFCPFNVLNFDLLIFSTLVRYLLYISSNLCLFVCMSDHNSGTPGRIYLKFGLGNSVEIRECY